MDVKIGSAGSGDVERVLIALIDNLIDIALPGSELPSGRIRASEIRGIMVVGLKAGINHKELSGLDEILMRMAMEDLSVLGEDGCERYAPALGKRKGFHGADDLLLLDSDHDALTGDSVHLLTEGAGAVKFFDLDILLDQALLHDGTDHLRGSRGTAGLALAECVVGIQAQQGTKLHCVVIPRGRKEVHAAAEGAGAGDCVVQCAVRRAVRHAYAGSDRSHGRHRTHPDDVVDVDIIREDGLLAAVQVDDRRIARFVDAEIVQPAAVLAELVTIVPILGGGLDIADEYGDAFRSLRLHTVDERLTPPDIYLFCEHNKAKIGNSDGISE